MSGLLRRMRGCPVRSRIWAGCQQSRLLRLPYRRTVNATVSTEKTVGYGIVYDIWRTRSQATERNDAVSKHFYALEWIYGAGSVWSRGDDPQKEEPAVDYYRFPTSAARRKWITRGPVAGEGTREMVLSDDRHMRRNIRQSLDGFGGWEPCPEKDPGSGSGIEVLR